MWITIQVLTDGDASSWNTVNLQLSRQGSTENGNNLFETSEALHVAFLVATNGNTHSDKLTSTQGGMKD